MIKHTSKRLIASIVLLAGLAVTPLAQAHAHLESASPANQSVVETSPQQLSLSFSEGVEPSFSGVTLKDGAGKVITTGKATVDAADNKKLLIPLSSPLAPEKYQVEWHVVSVDGHKTQGHYEFNVK